MAIVASRFTVWEAERRERFKAAERAEGRRERSFLLNKATYNKKKLRPMKIFVVQVCVDGFLAKSAKGREEREDDDKNGLLILLYLGALRVPSRLRENIVRPVPVQCRIFMAFFMALYMKIRFIINRVLCAPLRSLRPFRILRVTSRMRRNGMARVTPKNTEAPIF
jgi:hypothetical protein